MRFVIQRVSEASVKVDGNVIGSIEKGFAVLIGVSAEDDEAVADKLCKKLLSLRIFEDENGKTNLSLKDVRGSLLLISQFTLYADCKKGNRPSFIKAGAPEKANALYEYIIDFCRKELEVWKKEEDELLPEMKEMPEMPGTGTFERLKTGKYGTETAGMEKTEEADNYNAGEEFRVETGSFGADMKVSLMNDGPFTVILDSAEL